jgi:hypothetical protein
MLERRRTMPAHVKPSRWWYLLSVLLLVVGIGAVVFAWAWMISDISQPTPHVVVPGTGEVVLSRPGHYVICYEYRSVVDGRAYATPPEVPGLRCRLVCKATGLEVPLTSESGYSYTAGSRSGTGVWQFVARQSGAYELSAAYPPGVTGPAEVVLAVSGGFPWRPFVAVFIGTGLGLLCSLGALATLIVTLIRRQRALARRGSPLPPIPGVQSLTQDRSGNQGE